MVYTYYRGVLCVGLGCGAFIGVDSYTTIVKGGLAERDPGTVYCRKCGDVTSYGKVDLVYSLSPYKYLPLDSESG
jgi:hypothetical protein